MDVAGSPRRPAISTTCAPLNLLHRVLDAAVLPMGFPGAAAGRFRHAERPEAKASGRLPRPDNSRQKA